MGAKPESGGGGEHGDFSSDCSMLAVKWRTRPSAEHEHREGDVWVLKREEKV